jgi:hypothetical protein
MLIASLVEPQALSYFKTGISRMHPQIVHEHINASTQNIVTSNENGFSYTSISLCHAIEELHLHYDGRFVECWCKIRWQVHIFYLHTIDHTAVSVRVVWMSREFVGANQRPRHRLRWCTWETVRSGTMKTVRKVSEFWISVHTRRWRKVPLVALRSCEFA